MLSDIKNTKYWYTVFFIGWFILLFSSWSVNAQWNGDFVFYIYYGMLYNLIAWWTTELSINPKC
jgi:hypothetical protein